MENYTKNKQLFNHKKFDKRNKLRIFNENFPFNSINESFNF